MENLDLRSALAPFGQPDGSHGDPQKTDLGLVKFPRNFGDLSREPSESGLRVVVGTMGAGKSLFLRRMRLFQSDNKSVHAAQPESSSSPELTTHQIIKAAQLYPRSTSSEHWRLIWNRAIIRSAVSHVLNLVTSNIKSVQGAIYRMRNDYKTVLNCGKSSFSPMKSVSEIIDRFGDSYDSMQKHLSDSLWNDIEQDLSLLIENSKPIFLYIDAIDDNYKYAPAYWINCQRGLFIEVDALAKSERRLHVTIALRDVVYNSIIQNETGLRHKDSIMIAHLEWNFDRAKYFLREKVQQLPDIYFSNPESKTVSSWLGRESISNKRRNVEEDIEFYLLRHTRFTPRDIVTLGNSICEIQGLKLDDSKLSDLEVRSVVHYNARDFAKNQLGQVLNQIMTDVMPWNAARLGFSEHYITEYGSESMIGEIIDCLKRSSSEEFSLKSAKSIEKYSKSRFSKEARLLDVLWQNKVIAFWDKEVSQYQFFDRIKANEITLPVSDSYMFHPILLDIISDLELTENYENIKHLIRGRL
jgi:hypothetical protein